MTDSVLTGFCTGVLIELLDSHAVNVNSDTKKIIKNWVNWVGITNILFLNLF